MQVYNKLKRCQLHPGMENHTYLHLITTSFYIDEANATNDDKRMKSRNQHTERNCLRSLPDAISLNIAKALLISILIAEAICKTGSSGMCTCGILGGDLIKIKT